MTSIRLAEWTTAGVGGTADSSVVIATREQLDRFISGPVTDAPYVLAGGSNVLVSDDGLHERLVVLRGEDFLPPDIAGDRAVISALAPWYATVSWLVERGFQGVEALSGIPGTVGGAVVQNIGAYGVELSELIVSVETFDLATGRRSWIPNADCLFGYRTSRFKGTSRPGTIVLSIEIKLERGGLHQPRYADLGDTLRSRLGGADAGYDIRAVQDTVLALRRQKCMVYDPADPQTHGVGSFFVNPVIGADRLGEISKKSQVPPQAIPHWLVGDDDVKLGAGWLIEHAGFERGYRSGSVALARNHALSIVNVSGSARSIEILNLAGTVRRSVFETFGVVLELEPILMGFSPDALSILDVEV